MQGLASLCYASTYSTTYYADEWICEIMPGSAYPQLSGEQNVADVTDWSGETVCHKTRDRFFFFLSALLHTSVASEIPASRIQRNIWYRSLIVGRYLRCEQDCWGLIIIMVIRVVEFSGRVQNWKDFCLKINLSKGNYRIVIIGVVGLNQLSKVNNLLWVCWS